MALKSDGALALVQRAIDGGRLGHAYLITGPKEANREGFANRMLNLIAGTRHGDLDAWSKLGIPIICPESKSRKIKIDNMRALEHVMHMRTGPSGHKFGVIVDAERMTPEAQNAFLKTLEEPPNGSLLLLLTGKPEELLPTTLSRVIEIQLMAEDGPRQYTAHEQQLLELLTAQAKRPNTSMAAALTLKMAFESVLDAIRDGIEEAADEDFAKEKAHYGKTTDSGAYLKNREEQSKALVEATYLQQRDGLLELLLSWMGDILRHKVKAERLDLPEYAAVTSQLAERHALPEVVRRMRTLNRLEQLLHTNVNENLALEVCFIEAFG
jgi:DNA polymerase III subunit delta'